MIPFLWRLGRARVHPISCVDLTFLGVQHWLSNLRLKKMSKRHLTSSSVPYLVLWASRWRTAHSAPISGRYQALLGERCENAWLRSASIFSKHKFLNSGPLEEQENSLPSCSDLFFFFFPFPFPFLFYFFSSAYHPATAPFRMIDGLCIHSSL